MVKQGTRGVCDFDDFLQLTILQAFKEPKPYFYNSRVPEDRTKRKLVGQEGKDKEANGRHL